MESLNQALFLQLNAPAHPQALPWAASLFFAEYMIFLLPAGLLLGWLRGRAQTRRLLLLATVAGLVGLLFNQAIGLVWQHPRPFMVGVGHTLVAHVADSSFPSDHLTLWWAVAFGLAIQPGGRTPGVAMLLLGLPMAWARIYLGVRFPLDMVGALSVAALSAWLAWSTAAWYLPPVYGAALAVHRSLLGWVRP